jgi:glycosyltransferase involved in cell wall biosynthesis
MTQKNKEFKVAVICSFSDDEPLEEILDAAAALPNVLFYITGDKSRADKRILDKRNQKNVIFTGYLDHRKYVSVLRDADSIVVLTKRDRTMLAGAYEALALQKPLITSNWGALKRYFCRGTIHVDNSPRQIEAAVRIVQKKKDHLGKELYQLKLEKTEEWEKKFSAFKKLLIQDYVKYSNQNKTRIVDILTAGQ